MRACLALLVLALLPPAGVRAGEPETPGDRLVLAEDWRNYVRITHYDPAGIPCYDSRDAKSREVVRYLYFKEPLYLLSSRKGWAKVRVEEVQCWVRAKRIDAVHSRPVHCPANELEQPLFPLDSLVDSSAAGEVTPLSVGPFFPTFYQIAREVFYPPLDERKKLVALRDGKGKVIARVSPAFRRALLIQGTAALKDGTIVNVGRTVKGEKRYVVLPSGSYGLGVSGFSIYPYRSVAVDFDLLCDRLTAHGAGLGCTPGNALPRGSRNRATSRTNKKLLVGALLKVPAFAGARMADGQTHDGFVCAVDVGGGIKQDRMDVFVGTAGGGNPYYPPCRKENPLTRHGVESLIPCDWRHFEQNEAGVWKRAVRTEYRQVARHKGLEALVFPGLKCRKHTESAVEESEDSGR